MPKRKSFKRKSIKRKSQRKSIKRKSLKKRSFRRRSLRGGANSFADLPPEALRKIIGHFNLNDFRNFALTEKVASEEYKDDSLLKKVGKNTAIEKLSKGEMKVEDLNEEYLYDKDVIIAAISYDRNAYDFVIQRLEQKIIDFEDAIRRNSQEEQVHYDHTYSDPELIVIPLPPLPSAAQYHPMGYLVDKWHAKDKLKGKLNMLRALIMEYSH